MSDDSVDEFLAHHGIKGMHWGRHKAGSSSAASSRSTKRAEKSAAKESSQKSQDNLILNSRKSLNSAGLKVAKAKQDYKAARHTEGKAAAKEVLKKAKSDLTRHYNNAILETGQERTQRVIQEISDVAFKQGQAAGDRLVGKH